MTIASPIRFDRLQATLSTVIEAATGIDTSWGYGEKVYDADTDGDLISLKVITGPRDLNIRRKRGAYLLPPTQVDIAIDTPIVDGQRYFVEINGHGFYYDAGSGDAVGDVRDGLIADMDGETLFSAAASGDDVRITPAALGGVWQMALAGPLSATVTPATAAVRISEGYKRVTVAVQCFSKNPYPRSGAWDIATKAQAAFDAGDLLEQLEAAGAHVQSVGSGVDLSGVAGPAWESRVSFDLEIDLPCTFVRPVDHVETLNLDLSGVGAFTVAV